jgi:hypothetical protein
MLCVLRALQECHFPLHPKTRRRYLHSPLDRASWPVLAAAQAPPPRARDVFTAIRERYWQLLSGDDLGDPTRSARAACS